MDPAELDPEAWAGFVQMRKAMRGVPFTDRAKMMILRDLKQIKDAGYCPNAALDQSTLMGWRGVWPAKEKAIERAPSSQAAQTQAYLEKRGEGAVKPSQEVINKLRMVRNA